MSIPRTLQRLLAVAALLVHAGCADQAPPNQEVRLPRRMDDVGSVGFAGDPSKDVSPIVKAARSRLHPPADPATRTSAELQTANGNPGNTGLVGSLRNFVRSSPVFEEAEISDDLEQSLAAADDIFSKIKQGNRSSIRNANRQVRVGAARFSPNLILVEFERLGYGDLGCYGGMPLLHIDKVAAAGQRHTNFYSGSTDFGVAGNCLLTGRGPGHAVTEYKPGVPSSLPGESLSEMLWNAGYATGFVGLWDLADLPTSHGYDEWMGYRSRADISPYPEKVAVDSKHMRILANAGGAAKLRGNEILIHEACGFLERSREARHQWFLHVVLPAETAADLSHPQSTQESALIQSANALQSWDDDLGRLLAKLSELQLDASTCLIVTARCGAMQSSTGKDHRTTGGLSCSPHGLGEGNLRIPLIIRWPGTAAAGSTCETINVAWDLMPTFADIAVALRRPHSDGRSFRPELQRSARPEERLLFWQSTTTPVAQAVRLGHWKGTHVFGQSAVTLFDLNSDPSESSDVGGDHPDVVAKMLQSNSEKVRKHPSDDLQRLN